MANAAALPELDALTANELRALVRAYHATLQAIVLDNNAFSTAQETSNWIWAGRVNSRLAALFETFNAKEHPDHLQ